jgi:hypothetical protein
MFSDRQGFANRSALMAACVHATSAEILDFGADDPIGRSRTPAFRPSRSRDLFPLIR